MRWGGDWLWARRSPEGSRQALSVGQGTATEEDLLSSRGQPPRGEEVRGDLSPSPQPPAVLRTHQFLQTPRAYWRKRRGVSEEEKVLCPPTSGPKCHILRRQLRQSKRGEQGDTRFPGFPRGLRTGATRWVRVLSP